MLSSSCENYERTEDVYSKVRKATDEKAVVNFVAKKVSQSFATRIVITDVCLLSTAIRQRRPISCNAYSSCRSKINT